mmetsp:Transcript_106967/g.244945  ORF Transcript_106967/g.244945 Transcript_106967/m.244945 type:complete len:304 (-) Transcript_106967:675-1586(-)
MARRRLRCAVDPARPAGGGTPGRPARKSQTAASSPGSPGWWQTGTAVMVAALDWESATRVIRTESLQSGAANALRATQRRRCRSARGILPRAPTGGRKVWVAPDVSIPRPGAQAKIRSASASTASRVTTGGDALWPDEAQAALAPREGAVTNHTPRPPLASKCPQAHPTQAALHPQDSAGAADWLPWKTLVVLQGNPLDTPLGVQASLAAYQATASADQTDSSSPTRPGAIAGSIGWSSAPRRPATSHRILGLAQERSPPAKAMLHRHLRVECQHCHWQSGTPPSVRSHWLREAPRTAEFEVG